MKKVVYVLKPGVSKAVFKSRRVMPGELIDDPILAFNSSFRAVEVELDAPEVKEETFLPTEPVLTESPQSDNIKTKTKKLK